MKQGKAKSLYAVSKQNGYLFALFALIVLLGAIGYGSFGYKPKIDELITGILAGMVSSFIVTVYIKLGDRFPIDIHTRRCLVSVMTVKTFVPEIQDTVFTNNSCRVSIRVRDITGRLAAPEMSRIFIANNSIYAKTIKELQILAKEDVILLDKAYEQCTKKDLMTVDVLIAAQCALKTFSEEPDENMAIRYLVRFLKLYSDLWHQTEEGTPYPSSWYR